LHQQGMRFLAYFNPWLPSDDDLFSEGETEQTVLTYDNGAAVTVEFPWGAARGMFDPFTENGKNWFAHYAGLAIAQGVDGWMADYGEGMPFDAFSNDGRRGDEIHNLYPLEWAASSTQAWTNANRGDDYVFFNRSGYTGANS